MLCIMRKCRDVVAPNILTVKFRSQIWETSLARFHILLIYINPAKCCHLILSNTCVFSKSQFYDWRRIRCRPTLVLSPSLSLCLSAILSTCPLFRFDIKLIGLCAKIINWINAFRQNIVLISKGNIKTKVVNYDCKKLCNVVP